MNPGVACWEVVYALSLGTSIYPYIEQCPLKTQDNQITADCPEPWTAAWSWRNRMGHTPMVWQPMSFLKFPRRLSQNTVFFLILGFGSREVLVAVASKFTYFWAGFYYSGFWTVLSSSLHTFFSFITTVCSHAFASVAGREQPPWQQAHVWWTLSQPGPAQS